MNPILRNTESCALKSWTPRGSAARKGNEMVFLMFVVAAALAFAVATGFFAGKLVGMEQARREESEEYGDGDCDFLAAGMGGGDPGRTQDAGSADERTGEPDTAEGRTGNSLDL